MCSTWSKRFGFIFRAGHAHSAVQWCTFHLVSRHLHTRCLQAEKIMLDSEENKEYLPIQGLEAFNKATADLLLGKDHPAIKVRTDLTSHATHVPLIFAPSLIFRVLRCPS